MKTRSLFIPVFVLLIIYPVINSSCGRNPEKDKLLKLKEEVSKDLTGNILRYWTDKVYDKKSGGFYGRVDWRDSVYAEAERGGVVNARILWTYSSAYRVLGDTSWLTMAKHQRDYILNHFIDKEYGGAFRSVAASGEPLDTRKQIYIESFFIYAFSEYFRATGDSSGLSEAKKIYNCIEKFALDTVVNGYFEVFSRDWKRLPDRLIGEKSEKEEKTMNTHLHLLESYTSLYRVWKDPVLKVKLENLVDIFLEKIIDNKRYHLISFMERDWTPASNSDSYGHDIESSWLLCEAADLLGDTDLEKRVREVSIKIADAAAEGLLPDGGMVTEKNLETGEVRDVRSWWEQSETVIGYLYAYEITGDSKYLDKVLKSWEFIKGHFIDHKNGGWFSNVKEDGTPGRSDKAGFWICPYHNGRMALEVIERISE
jgi:mannobiose 2-epimerase